MKILLVVGVLVLVTIVLYRVVRPILNLVRQFRLTVRHFQTISTRARPSHTAEKLVKCETCQTWIPQSRAFSANAHEYCSQVCLKRGTVNQRQKKIG